MLSGFRKMCKPVAAVFVLAVLVAVGLAGCTKTITVTGKYRSMIGWYYVCDGPRFAPCLKTTIYHVSKASYDQARVGRTYTLNF